MNPVLTTFFPRMWRKKGATTQRRITRGLENLRINHFYMNRLKKPMLRTAFHTAPKNPIENMTEYRYTPAQKRNLANRRVHLNRAFTSSRNTIRKLKPLLKRKPRLVKKLIRSYL